MATAKIQTVKGLRVEIFSRTLRKNTTRPLTVWIVGTDVEQGLFFVNGYGIIFSDNKPINENFKKRIVIVMVELMYSAATENNIDFIRETYQENIASLHGNHRTNNDWKALLSDKSSQYYIVHSKTPVAWFRIDMENGELWIGMIQVKPMYHHQGVGKYILSVTENIARQKGIQRIGIHTTEDNIAARSLYLSAGYEVTEIGPCTTADGIERVGYTYQKEI